MPRMQLFKLSTLHLVQGLAEDFDAALKAAVQDCAERPGNQKARKVSITVDVTPLEGGDGVTIHATSQGRLPNRQASAYRMLATANGGLKFNPDSPAEPAQGTMDFEDQDPED